MVVVDYCSYDDFKQSVIERVGRHHLRAVAECCVQAHWKCGSLALNAWLCRISWSEIRAEVLVPEYTVDRLIEILYL